MNNYEMNYHGMLGENYNEIYSLEYLHGQCHYNDSSLFFILL